MTHTVKIPSKSPSHGQLWAEFLLLFVGAPLVMAFLMPPSWIYRTIAVMLVIGVVFALGLSVFFYHGAINQ